MPLCGSEGGVLTAAGTWPVPGGGQPGLLGPFSLRQAAAGGASGLDVCAGTRGGPSGQAGAMSPVSHPGRVPHFRLSGEAGDGAGGSIFHAG